MLAKPEEHDAKTGKRYMNPDASDSPEQSFDLPNFNPNHDPRANASMHQPGSGPSENSYHSEEEKQFQ